MKKLLSALFILISLFIIFPSSTHAQDADYIAKYDLMTANLLEPTNPQQIDPRAKKVKFQFLNPGIDQTKIYVCLRTNLCVKNPSVLDKIANASNILADKLLSKVGIQGSDLDTNAFTKDENKYTNLIDDEGNLTVCGDGDSKLKVVENRDCSPSDYFHAGKTYVITLYVLQGGSNYVVVGQAAFYVNHYYPAVDVRLIPNGSSYQFQVGISGDRSGGGNNENNYQISVKDVGDPQCVVLPGEKYFPKDNKATLVPGQYIIDINEQVNDSNNWSCGGGFTYWRLVCKIIPPTSNSPASIEQHNFDGTPQNCLRVKDPNNSESTPDDPQLSQAKNPCRPFPNGTIFGHEDLTRCVEFGSAIGGIGTSPLSFITTIFSILLIVAGAGAIGLIIFAGYRLMTSRGNKEAIQSARESITSAIIGLIFIILSFVILSVIGSQILQIPGFS